MMLQWLFLLTLFFQKGWASSLSDELEDSRLWRRGSPSVFTAPREECTRDMLVIWDNSQSVGIGNFLDNVRPFLKKLVADPKLDVGKDGTHIGFITFASEEKTRRLLKIGSIMEQEDLQSWLDGLNYVEDLMGPYTYTGLAFKLASDEYHSRNPLNHRTEIDDVILLFTDGEPRARTNALIKEQYEMADEYSASLMARNVSIIALAVGKEAEKPEFRKNIKSWSNHMFTSAFDKLDDVLAKIVDESCGVKPLQCACDGEISTEQYTKPGENTIFLSWLEPELKCDKSVEPDMTVDPSNTQNPQEFGIGEHKIKYTFAYKDSDKKWASQDCLFTVNVGACECPSTQTIRAQVKLGETKATVNWLEPEPSCPARGNGNNPSTTSGDFPVGKHKLVYDYKHSTEFQTFYMQCVVNIIVTGDYCGTTAYDPGTYICCCGKAYPKKSGHRCCGTKYYDTASMVCCQDESLVSVEGHCPFQMQITSR
ncbi:uncharacterized protein LOC114534612 [Dendronephthya gigantea]|uniref:uncharacterized protein LOC114534612 n=1 Tax=Dendronephthya gigantea TaxID=151771 RepID=UPI00106CE63A|nr:uncharacterized protein LOC114534612 [Dendronephthya gigantea]